MNSQVLSAGDTWMKMSKEPSLTWPPPPPSPPPQGFSDSLPEHSKVQLELFHKLGYSTEQVERVLRKFGPALDTDKLLEKLVKICGVERSAPVAVHMNVPVTQAEARAERAPARAERAPARAERAPAQASGPGQAEAGQSLEESGDDEDPFRHIVIDGSNVAMSHGNKEVFSCLGIQLAVNFFLERGHRCITVFVPQWRNEKPRPDVPISDQHILLELEKKKLLVFTPSKRVGGKRIACHDDRYIVKLAFEEDGLIVSNDMYRDLQRENPEWKRFIEERLIMFSFVNNKFMPPDDPMGRHGPSLDDLRLKCPIVQKKQNCPYGRKCTFGIKCRFLHPERPKQSNQTLADELRSLCSHSSLPPPTPAPGQSLSLVEDMAHKLTLGGSVKKDHHSETTSHGKGGHGKKTCSKERKSRHSSLEHGSVVSGGGDSHEFDSGLGSIDPYTNLYSQPHSAPCHSCHVTAPHHGFHRHAMARSDVNLAYNMSPYPSYGPYGGGMQAYSQPPDFQHCVRPPPQQMYWSDPYMAPPRALRRVPEDSPEWEQSQASAGHGKDQREGVRKKLLAIFSTQLVDAAMNLHPQLLDPQKLAAEILRLQSQGL